MHKFWSLALMASLTALAPVGSWAGSDKIELLPSAGSTKFLAVGRPSMLKIRGEGQGPKGNLEFNGQAVQGQVQVDLSTLVTGIELRDQHMKEKYLEVGKHRMATLSLRSLALPTSLPFEGPFEGDLELHGQKQPVKGIVKVQSPKPGRLAFEATFPLKITDFKIDIPSYAGIKIADEVSVEVRSETTAPKR